MAEPEVGGTSPICQDVEPGTYWWCACGRSSNQPFCDGSHAGTGFSPVEVKIADAQNVAWCCCKRTSNKPFCDGSHNQLSP